jgi:predicted DNA-binding protein
MQQNSEGKRTIAIKLPVEMIEQIEALAQRAGSPVASMVRVWVVERVTQEKERLKEVK